MLLRRVCGGLALLGGGGVAGLLQLLQELVGGQVLGGLLVGIALLLRLLLGLLALLRDGRALALGLALLGLGRLADRRRIVRAGLAHVVHGILAHLEAVVVAHADAHLHQLPDGVDLRDHAHAVRGHDVLAHPRHALEGLLVGVLLVLQAAHEPAAQAGDLRRIQRQVLLLRHLDGHRLEVAQERAAADGPPAGAQTAQHLRLVAHADLAQLDAHLEHAGQILHQLAEVHAAVGGEIEDDLGVVEGVLHAHQLHLQLVPRHLLLTDAERLLLAAGVVLRALLVLLGGDAHHLLQRRDDLLVADGARAGHDLAELDAARGLHHHVLTRLGPEVAGVKIIYLARLLEADADHCCHLVVPPVSLADPPDELEIHRFQHVHPGQIGGKPLSRVDHAAQQGASAIF